MEGSFNLALRSIQVELKNRSEFRRNYLSSPPHGGIMVSGSTAFRVGEVVELKIHCAETGDQQSIRGAVLWCRSDPDRNVKAGIGFLASEVEKREQLLGNIPKPLALVRERKEARYRATLKVTYKTATDFLIDYTRNISTGGLFVESRQSPIVGSKILFKLYPPGFDDPIELTGQVAWRRPDKGFGVRFSRASDSARNRLSKLVRSIAVVTQAEVAAPSFEEYTPS